MRYLNTRDGYGVVSRVIHWSMAIAIISMFALGLWMRTLDYYSPWYREAPEIHKSVGIILLGLLVLRFIWRIVTPRPGDENLTPLERRVSSVVHWGFYPLLLALMISGYLISTADGRAIEVFGLFSVPAVYEQKGMEDLAGFIHEWLAYGVIAVASVHALAALKHHLVDRDDILTRMLKGPPEPTATPQHSPHGQERTDG